MAFASSNGCRLHYSVEGGGEPLVLIPGLGGSARQLSQISEILSRSHRVITVDPRGAGQSDKPDQPYDGAMLAGDLAAVMDDADVEAADVIGISFGGMIAQEFALRHPERLRSMVLASSYAASDGWTERMWQVRSKLIGELGMEAHFSLALMFLFSPRSFRRDAETIARIEKAFRDSPPDPVGYVRQLDFCRTFDVTGRLGAVAAPSLVVTGAEDILATPILGRELAHAIPGALYHEEPEAAHLYMLSHPEAFIRTVEQFLSGLAR
ncbi:alpha/beta hydrolase [Pelagibius sp. CAU 1746]|uniref:alpha/beta fold hydrolase n=1 Tax=Pelagibius sp. CAU 1746 TaxID=3140370 RepID=UPI00325AE634